MHSFAWVGGAVLVKEGITWEGSLGRMTLVLQEIDPNFHVTFHVLFHLLLHYRGLLGGILGVETM